MRILAVYYGYYCSLNTGFYNLFVQLEKDETVHIGDSIAIEMMEDSFTAAQVILIDPKTEGDFACVSQKAAERVRSGECGVSKETETYAKGPGIARLIASHIPWQDDDPCKAVKTAEKIKVQELLEEYSDKVCLSPYKELRSGDESIHDHVQPGYSVPEQVIEYLRSAPFYYCCPGIYEHPFKPGTRLLGPNARTDGTFYWDVDLWEYVSEYHVVLPQAFVDHVMSETGAAMLEAFRLPAD